MSCNLRTLISVLDDDLPPGAREAFLEALRKASPVLWERVVGRGR